MTELVYMAPGWLLPVAIFIAGIVTKKDLGVIVGVISIAGLYLSSQHTWTYESVVVGFATLNAAVVVLSRMHWEIDRKPLGRILQWIGLAALMNNGAMLVQYQPIAMDVSAWIALGAQVAAFIAVIRYDGRRAIISDFIHDIGSCFHLMSDTARRVHRHHD